MTNNHHIGHGWAAGIICLLLISCSVQHTATGFVPEQISCVDNSTAEMKHAFEESWGKLLEPNPLPAHYIAPTFANHDFDALIANAKRLADSGNQWSIGYYGDMQFEASTWSYTHPHNGNSELTLPNPMRQDIVTTLSYLYIARNFESYSSQAENLLLAIEKHEQYNSNLGTFKFPKIPTAWIDEAKANADNWKAHCAEH